MEPTILSRIFTFSSTSNTADLVAAAKVIRALLHSGNPPAAAGAIAAIVGELEAPQQERVVAAIEVLVK